jgi:hypothetical protein
MAKFGIWRLSAGYTHLIFENVVTETQEVEKEREECTGGGKKIKETEEGRLNLSGNLMSALQVIFRLVAVENWHTRS